MKSCKKETFTWRKGDSVIRKYRDCIEQYICIQGVDAIIETPDFVVVIFGYIYIITIYLISFNAIPEHHCKSISLLFFICRRYFSYCQNIQQYQKTPVIRFFALKRIQDVNKTVNLSLLIILMHYSHIYCSTNIQSLCCIYIHTVFNTVSQYIWFIVSYAHFFSSCIVAHKHTYSVYVRCLLV